MSYAINVPARQKKLGDVAEPSVFLHFIDSTAGSIVRNATGCCGGRASVIGFRHNEGANCSFFDGHVKWQKQSELLGTTGSKMWEQ